MIPKQDLLCMIGACELFWLIHIFFSAALRAICSMEKRPHDATEQPPATEQPTKRKRDGQTAENRQPLQEKQDASGSAPSASHWRDLGLAIQRCQQQQARHTYTLPPGVSSDGLSEKEIARGDFYLRPNDRLTVRQQDLLIIDEEDGSEDGWKYSKDETIG